MRILSVVGARPQFVKLAPIAHACTAAHVEHVIVHTGQHYDPLLSEVFFEDLGIPTPNHHLGAGSGSHGRQTGAIMSALEPVLAAEKPDWVMIYGDTNSTLAGAICAAKQHFPLAHLEAGLRSFNRAMPEEINRVLSDHAADILLAPTQTSANNLAREGLEEKTVIVGDVMTDVLIKVKNQVESDPSPITERFGWESGSYVLATIHRAENTDDPLRLKSILSALGKIEIPVVLLAHPRLVAKARAVGANLEQGNLHPHEPLPYPLLVAATRSATHVVTDSGGLQKEAFLLRIPTTTIRSETEWVETVELGWNKLVDPENHTDLTTRVYDSVHRQPPVPTSAIPYGDGYAAERVVETLLSTNLV